MRSASPSTAMRSCPCRTGLASGVKLTLEAIPDKPPVIAFSAPPEVNARGTFNLTYKGSDDYGITGIEGNVEKADASRGRRSLVPAPTLALALPADGNAETKSPVDLTNHPWAGARVKLQTHREGRRRPGGSDRGRSR